MRIDRKRVLRLAFRLGMAAAGAVGVMLMLAPSSTRAASSLGLWTPLPDAPSAHQNHTATLLLDGKVLVAGGFVEFQTQPASLVYTAAAALYRPAPFDDWLPLPSMSLPRGNHGAALAGDGTVVVAGGETTGTGLNFFSEPNCGLGLTRDPVSSVEIFDPTTLGWRLGPVMSQPRADFGLVRLADGKVLAAGGANSRATEIYDPATGAWSTAGTMHSSRAGAAYARLTDGRVVVAGGNFGAIWPFCDSTADADALIAAAQTIRSALGC